MYVYTKEEAILNEWDMSLQEIPPTQGSSIEFLTVTIVLMGSRCVHSLTIV